MPSVTLCFFARIRRVVNGPIPLVLSPLTSTQIHVTLGRTGVRQPSLSKHNFILGHVRRVAGREASSCRW